VRNQTLSALVFVFLTLPTAAQFTTVSGTVADPNGLPYANGAITATLVTSASPTLNGFAYTPPTQPVGLNTAGSFTMRLADNTVLLPGATQWKFQVCSAGGTVQPAGGKGPVCFTAGPLTISGSSQSITATLTAVALPLANVSGGVGGSGSAGLGIDVTNPPASLGVSGLKCDGSTDDAPALNTLQSALQTAGTGGTLVFPAPSTLHPKCVLATLITLPNDGIAHTDTPGTTSAQVPIRWTSAGMPGWPNNVFTFNGGAILDLQCNVTNCPNYKIITFGLGNFEIDHLMLIDSLTDCQPFFFTSSTSLRIHDNGILGTTISSPPTYSCNDIFTLGAQNAAIAFNSLNSGFQGYNSVIENNSFDRVRSGVLFGFYVNGIIVRNNKVWANSGCLNCGWLDSTGNAGGNSANVIEQNTIEVPSYPHAIGLLANNFENVLIGNGCYDTVTFSTVCNYVPSGAQNNANKIIPGYSSAYQFFVGDNSSLYYGDYLTGNLNSVNPLAPDFLSTSSTNGNEAMLFPYGFTGSTSFGLQAVANANEVDCIQMQPLPNAITIGHITTRLATSFGVGSKWAVGIYSMIGQIIANTGALDGTVTTPVTTAITAAVLRPGAYYFCQTGTTTTGQTLGSSTFSTTSVMSQTLNTGSALRVVKGTNVSAAGVLPATLGVLTTISAGYFPAIVVVEP
jgi:hypothetical protein